MTGDWRIDNFEEDVPGGLIERIWARDPSVWAAGEDDPSERLGWLDLPDSIRGELAPVEAFVRDTGSYMDRAILLGMGGSSLAPEVFAACFGTQPGHPLLTILDSTHPTHIETVAAELGGSKNLFLVSSKSGGTIETMSLYHFFRERAEDARDYSFAAITDPGTSLQELGKAEDFAGVFLNPPDLGGRYSALSLFGLVPAALIGVDLDALLSGAAEMAEACGPKAPVADNPGLAIGHALGTLAARGRDKLTFFTSDALAPFGDWVEQLVAESSGKAGHGIVPVTGEPPAEGYGNDRVFVDLRLQDDASLDGIVDGLAEAGHPVIHLPVRGPEELGAQMFLWEFATAIACSVLGVNAFDQPDVEAAKRAGREALASSEVIVWEDEDISALFEDAAPGDYAAFLAFTPRSVEAASVLDRARKKVGRDGEVATTAGFGPRYLHSTGQLHKGGPDSVRALVILDPPQSDLAIPGEEYGFSRLLQAQAAGDYRALRRAGKRVARTGWARFEEWASS